MASFITMGNGGSSAPGNLYTTSGTVEVGDVVYLTSSLTVARADADNASARPPIGVVTNVSGGTAAVVGSGALAYGLSGLTPGAVYWLSTTAGQMTTTQPASNAYIVGVAISSTQMLMGTIAVDLAGTGGGGGGSDPTFNSVTTSSMTVLNQGTVSLRESTDNGTNTISLRAPAGLSSDVTLTLPNSSGTNGQLLSTDGSGNLSWATGGGGGGGGAGALSVVEFTATTSSTSSATTIPTGAIPISVSVQITSAYSAGTVIEIGYTGSTSFLMPSADNLPGTLGIYSNNLMGLSWTSNPVLISIGGMPSTGACRVRVVYAETPNS